MNIDEYYANLRDVKELSHHGILGQKWGVRRYQNPDGTLTDLGRKKLGYKEIKSVENAINKSRKAAMIDRKRGGRTRKWDNALIQEDKVIRSTESYKKAMTSLDVGKLNFREIHNIAGEMDKLSSLEDDGDAATLDVYKAIEYSGDTTIGKLAHEAYGSLYDDYDQRFPTTTTMMLVRTGNMDNAKKLVNDYTSLTKERDDSIDKYIDDYYSNVLADNNLENSNGVRSAKIYIKSLIRNDVSNKSITDIDGHENRGLYSVVSGVDRTINDKTYKQAKTTTDLIMSKIDKYTPKLWLSLWTVTKELGIDNKEIQDISDSEWREINELIKTHQGY